MLIPDGYGQTTIKYQIGASGEICVVTYGFHNTPVDTADVIADSMATTWDGNFSAADLSDQWELLSAYVLISIGGVMQSSESVIGTVGTRSTGPPSPAIALGVKKQTTYAGKKYRGRMYLPAGLLREDHIDPSGEINSGDVAGYQGDIDNVKGLNNTDGYPWYLLHSDATDPTPIESLIVRNRVRTQRRRQRLV